MLAGVRAQTRRPDRTVVTCDVDDPDIRELVRREADEFRTDLTLVMRPHRGQSRSAQVRNNGVRAISKPELDRGALLIFLDGDCCPAPGCFAAHERLGANGELVVGFRIDLTEPQTEQFDPARLSPQQDPVEITADQRRALADRDQRYRRHAFMRRFGLAKAHKPKLLSANFAISAAIYHRINGFDEQYLGYGGEDDDLGRRVYAAGGRPVIGIGQAIAYHLWHPTRAAARWEDSPGVARFRTRTPTRAEFGLDRAYDQPAPTIERFTSSAARLAGATP